MVCQDPHAWEGHPADFGVSGAAVGTKQREVLFCSVKKSVSGLELFLQRSEVKPFTGADCRVADWVLAMGRQKLLFTRTSRVVFLPC